MASGRRHAAEAAVAAAAAKGDEATVAAGAVTTPATAAIDGRKLGAEAVAREHPIRRTARCIVRGPFARIRWTGGGLRREREEGTLTGAGGREREAPARE